MNIDEARQQVRKTKPRENFMMVQVGYGNNIILPYSQGLKLVESLVTAEVYETPYQGIHTIKPLPQDTVTWKCMSADEYEDIKVSHLLGIKWNDFVEAKKNPTQ